MKDDIAIFEDKGIRRIYDEATETWYFSVVDIIGVLTDQSDFQTARKYWNKLKERLSKEGSETVTNCHRLKLTAQDGKKRITDVADAQTLLRLVQSVPSPRAEPIKLWLAKVGYERIQEMADPELALNRSREYWREHGRSEKRSLWAAKPHKGASEPAVDTYCLSPVWNTGCLYGNECCRPCRGKNTLPAQRYQHYAIIEPNLMSSVDIASMPYRENQHHDLIILNVNNNPIISNSIAP